MVMPDATIWAAILPGSNGSRARCTRPPTNSGARRLRCVR
jgi:hypothetical protein